jgi:hypothetical protein
MMVAAAVACEGFKARVLFPVVFSVAANQPTTNSAVAVLNTHKKRRLLLQLSKSSLTHTDTTKKLNSRRVS